MVDFTSRVEVCCFLRRIILLSKGALIWALVKLSLLNAMMKTCRSSSRN
jgi:hypothetical protein